MPRNGTLPKIHKDRERLERVRKQGRRRAITQADLKAIMQVRLSKTGTMRSGKVRGDYLGLTVRVRVRPLKTRRNLEGLCNGL